MKKIDFASFIPYIICILAFYVLTFLYFKPELINGDSLRQDDMINFKGVVKQVADHFEKTGEVSMWSGSMFSGVPAYLFYSKYSYGGLTFIDAALCGFIDKSKGAHLFFLSMSCTFIMLLCFRIKPFLSALCAIAFALTTYNLILIEVGHVTKLWAICYGALLLGGMKLVFDGKRLLGFALTALAMALEILATHLQITYYFAFVCFFFVLSEVYFALQTNTLKKIGIDALILGVAVSLGVATNAGKLMTTQEYSAYSTRGKSELAPLPNVSQPVEGLDRDYAFSWSQGKGETLTLLIPYLYGGASGENLGKESATYKAVYGENGKEPHIQVPLYWGDQPFTVGPIYAGAIICFLFILGLLVSERQNRYWILGGALLMMMFAWGRNFELLNYVMFDYFPAFNKFRSVSMALSITILLMALMAGIALEKAFEAKELDADLQKKFLYAFLGTAGFSLFIGLGAGMIDVSSVADSNYGQAAEFIRQDRTSYLRKDAFRSFILIALVVVAFYLMYKNKISKTIALALVSIFTAGDVWFVGKRYLSYEHFSPNPAAQVLTPSPADQKILQDKEIYRVLNLNNPFNDARTSYFHHSIGGYFAVKLRRYQDLIDRGLQPQIAQMFEDLRTNKADFEKYRLLNMLNMRYVKAGEEAAMVFANPSAYGNAWFVKEIKAVTTADEEIAAIQQQELRTTAVVNTSAHKVSKNQFDLDSTATIKLISYTPNYLKYESNNSKDGFAVLSEVYYPKGWTITLDGKPIEMVCANFVLRGVEIPAGKHTIECRFEPQSYSTGAKITEITSHLVFGIFLISLGMALYKEMKAE